MTFLYVSESLIWKLYFNKEENPQTSTNSNLLPFVTSLINGWNIYA